MSLLLELEDLLEKKGSIQSMPIFKKKFDLYNHLVSPESKEPFGFSSSEKEKIFIRKLYHLFELDTPQTYKLFVIKGKLTMVEKSSFKQFLASKHEHGVALFNNWVDGADARSLIRVFKEDADRKVYNGKVVWYDSDAEIALIDSDHQAVWVIKP